MKKQHVIAIVVGAVALVASTAAATSFIAHRTAQQEAQAAAPKPAATRSKALPWRDRQAQYTTASAQSSKPACDDGNALGYIVGGVGGGIVGNQIGKGSGNTAATIGGVLGGAYLGGQHLPLKNTLCR